MSHGKSSDGKSGLSRRTVNLALASTVLAAGTSPARAADPVKIRIGWSTMPGHLIPVLYSKPEVLKHIGKSYTVEPVLFRGSSPQITAMAAGEIDLAAFSPLVLALAVSNAKLDVRVVADMFQDGVPGHHSETFLVKTDGPIKTIADLKGKRIGTNAIGSAADTAMRVVMKKNGMLDKRDFTVVEAAFPNIPAMLDEGKLDIGAVVQPMSGILRKSGKYTALFQSKDAFGPAMLVFLAGRGEFLDKNRAVLMDYFEDHVRAVRWFTNPANRTEAVDIISKFMKQPPENLSHLFTENDYFRDPFMQPNIESLQRAVELTHDVGLAPAKIEVAPKHVDKSFTDEARKRIEANP
jgi:sulfonate transport system substrate-binding protein